MAVSSKLSTKTQVKSISLPCRSHPTTIRIEQQLNAAKLATTLPSAQTICNGLSQLSELYKSMDDLLNMSTTRVSISRSQNKEWVEDVVDESVKFLDVCGSTRDMVGQIKEHVTDVLCALRRRRISENNVDYYSSFRRKMRKDVKKLVASLKEVDNTIGGGSMVVGSDNHQLAAVMKAVVGVSEMTVAVFESLLLFLAMPVSKAKRWSLVVSKLMHKGMVACDDQRELGILNELESIDAGLQALCKDGLSDKIKTAKCRLERVEVQLECIESGLESILRRLIGTRTSLLNIMSQ